MSALPHSAASRHFDVIVIGAGAAGMMCAAGAGQRGRRVLVIDHATKLAEKIRISGGGRCNFTNLDVGIANYLSRNPQFCRSALSRYTPGHFIELVNRHGIAGTSGSTASCSATTRPRTSLTCCAPNARTAR